MPSKRILIKKQQQQKNPATTLIYISHSTSNKVWGKVQTAMPRCNLSHSKHNVCRHLQHKLLFQMQPASTVSLWNITPPSSLSSSKTHTHTHTHTQTHSFIYIHKFGCLLRSVPKHVHYTRVHPAAISR